MNELPPCWPRGWLNLHNRVVLTRVGLLFAYLDAVVLLSNQGPRRSIPSLVDVLAARDLLRGCNGGFRIRKAEKTVPDGGEHELAQIRTLLSRGVISHSLRRFTHVHASSTPAANLHLRCLVEIVTQLWNGRGVLGNKALRCLPLDLDLLGLLVSVL